MASEIASLAVRIGADASLLVSEMGKANRSTQGLSAQFRSGISQAAKYGSAITAAGVAIGVALVRRSMQAIDAQTKLARQLRATTIGLESVTRAADLAGIGNEKMAQAAKRLDVAIGDALMGMKQQERAFEALGLSAEAVSRMDIDERIASITRALRENVPASQRAAVAGELFGNRMATAIQELDAAAIADARREVIALGTAVSRVDGETIERANDALSSIGEVIRGMGNRLAVAVAPAIEHIATKFRETAIEAEGWKNEMEAAINTVIKGVGFAANAIHGLATVGSLAGDAVVIAFTRIQHAMLKLQKLGAQLSLFDPTAPQRIREIEAELRIVDSTMANAVQNMRDSLNAPLPGAAIERFFADAAEQAKLKGRKAGKDFQEGIAEGSQEVDPTGRNIFAELENAMEAVADSHEEFNRAELERRTRNLEGVKTSLMSEEQLQTESWIRRQVQLNEALNSQIVTLREFDELKRKLESDHFDAIWEIRKRNMTDLEKFTAASYDRQVKTVATEMANMTAGIAHHSRKAFEVNKIAGIANAIVSAYEGISRTLGAYPYPLNIGLAAAHAAAAFAQVSAIKSQQFGGGSAAPSLAGGTSATPVTPVSGGTPQGQQSTIINLQGETFGRKQLRDLFEQLNEGSRDGGRFILA